MTNPFKLHPYQEEITQKALPILNEYGCVYLAMEVRTGKTLTALNICKELKAKNILFLTKKKAISSILKDFELLGKPYEITIINYEQLHNINPRLYDVWICDEAHCLGAFPKPAMRTKQLRDSYTGQYVIYLSGTPSPESFSQLFHQLWICGRIWKHKNFYHWANDGYVVKRQRILHSGLVYNDYKNTITDISKMRKADNIEQEKLTNELTQKAIEKIRNDIDKIMIRFSQTEAGIEQEVVEEVLKVKMCEGTYELINELKTNRVLDYYERDVIADTNISLMQKLHQMYSGTLITESNGNREAVILDDTKAQYIKQNFSDKKIAIFYKFVAEGDMLRNVFPNNTSSPEEFNSNENLIFISQVVSGREGISLKTADCLIFFNIDFSALSYLQSKARLQDMIRTKEAKVYWLFSENGIEEKIYRMVTKKKDYTLRYFKKDFLN